MIESFWPQAVRSWRRGRHFPSKRSLPGLVCLIFLFLATVVVQPENVIPSTYLTQVKSVPKQTLVFVVSGEGSSEFTMDAVVAVASGKFKAPYREDSEAAQQRFANEFFQAGKQYRLTFGGGVVGTATIKKWDRGCNNIHADVAVATRAKIHGQLMALATDADGLGANESRRRTPTEAERAAVMKLVNQIYRAKGTTATLLRHLQTTNLTATDLNADGNFELIGSFVIQTADHARRDLFLIAEPQAAGFRTTLSEYQAYKLPAEGFDSAMTFVDQLDLDGDGIGEVFVTQHGFDAYGYAIYKKQADRWRKVYSTIGDAC